MGIPPIQPYPMPSEDELPQNVANWEIDPDSAVLLIHDMQQYFVEPFPADQSPGRELLRNAGLIREHCEKLGIPIAYTAQPGSMTEKERGLLKDMWGPGMERSEEHRRIIDAVTPGDDDRMFTKWRYSAFHGNDMLDWFRESGREQVIICGVYAHVGVLMTALDAFTNDIKPFLVADAIADFSADYHWLTLTYAAERCAYTLSTAAVLRA